MRRPRGDVRLALAGFDDLHLTFNATDLGIWSEETEDLVAVTMPMSG